MSSSCECEPAEQAGAVVETPQQPGQRRREGLAREYLRRNYLALALDGGLYIGGIAFVNMTTLMPDIVRKLGGPKFLIALMPTLVMLGMQATPIFTAHWLDSLRRYHKTLLGFGLLQRGPYLIAGLVLLLAAGHDLRWLMLAAVALAPLVSGVAGGVALTGFQQIVRKQIPERRRSSLFALRMAMGALIGVGAGALAGVILERWPNPTGYGLLFVLAYAVLMGSWVSFAAVRETPEPRRRGRDALQLVSNLRRMPRLMVANRGFRAYLAAQFFQNGQFILIPFIATYARESLQLEQSFLGKLVMVQSIGALVGNMLAAWAGDRFGSKTPMTLGAATVLVLAVGAALAGSATAYLGLFFVLGVSLALTMVGRQALVLGVCPEEDKSTYLSLASIVNVPAALASAVAATLIPTDSLVWLALATGLCMVASLTALQFVPNPGQREVARG